MTLSKSDCSDIIALAWADDVPFAAIAKQYHLSEPGTIALMRSSLKSSSFKLWRKRVTGRKSKHQKLLKRDF